MSIRARAVFVGSTRAAGAHPRSAAFATACAFAVLVFAGIGAPPASADTLPSVSGETASEVGVTTARLSGQVNPNGTAGDGNTTWRIQYRLQDAEEWVQANEWTIEPPASEEANPVEVEAILGFFGELQPGETYEFRLVAENGAGSDETEAPYPTFTMETVDPPVVTINDADSVTDSSAHFTGTVEVVDADPAFDASCRFEYIGQPAYEANGGTFAGAKSVACEPPTIAGSEPQPVAVEAEVESLAQNTIYHLRLVAENVGGATKVQAEHTFRTEAVAPTVKPFEADPVRSSTARLNGEVNPNNSATTYWFEWGTEDCSITDCLSVPVEEDAFAGSDGLNRYVYRTLTGLDPETTYHFRLMAENGAGVTAGPDREFTTPSLASETEACANLDKPGAGLLSDCRAWEMVSPPDKRGGDVTAEASRTRAAADGNGIGFVSLGGFGDVQGTAGIGTDYLSRRQGVAGTNGWSTHSITPRQEARTIMGVSLLEDPMYEGDFSPNLSKGIYNSWLPLTDAPTNLAEIPNLYLREDLTTPGLGSYQLLSNAAAPISAAEVTFAAASDGAAPALVPAGASADFSKVIFETRLNLAAGATGFQIKLYEWENGVTRLASRVPKSPATSCDDSTASVCEQSLSSRAGLGALGGKKYTSQMISDDGSRVFFKSLTGKSNGKIFARENGAATIQLNVSEKESEPKESPKAAELWAASADGSRVFFSTGEGLVDGDSDGGIDLYLYDFQDAPGDRLTLISVDEQMEDPGELESLIGISDDGAHVYFAAAGQLVAGAPKLAAERGLYHWHDGQLSYLGYLAVATDAGLNGPNTNWTGQRGVSTGRVSPDGRHLLFMSHSGAGLAGRGGFEGYDHGSACTFDDNSGSSCRELYLYNADSGRLSCVSCNPSGTAATSSALNQASKARGGMNPTWHLSRALASDGSRVFFSTGEALVPEDTNDLYDAYEYDAAADTAHLLSSGTDDADSYFLDASVDGDDVFFVTRERLSDWDVDGNYDLYDARVGGGFPEPEPVLTTCDGESCRAPSDPPPAEAGVGSATLVGARNPRPPRRCRKGQRRVQVKGTTRCVKRKRANANRRAGR